MMTVAAAALTAVAVESAYHAPESPLDLLATIPAKRRALEPRLTGGFSWAPFRVSESADEAAEELALSGAVTALLDRIAGDPSPAARHAKGIVQLLADDPRQALVTLSEVAATTGDPRAWSDVAAALYEIAARYDAPERLAEALAAADRALLRNPRLVEALFNRAIVLERLGLRDDAREAWRIYLAAEDENGWAAEARMRIRSLTPEVEFMERVDRAYHRLQRDSAVAAALTRDDPQGARGYGTMEILGRWGTAVRQGDEANAAGHLRVARALGGEVARVNGDHLLARAVASIDAADDAARALLASAHIEYRGGLQTLQANRPEDAEAQLHRSAAAFERAGSPMAFLARYFAACSMYEQGRRDDAFHELETLLAVLPSGLPACRAMIEWQLGVCQGSAGTWGAAFAFFERSATALERLGELQNAAKVRRVAAYSYERSGDPVSAWKQRMFALRNLGRRSGLPLVKAVGSIVDAAMLRHDWHTAESFLGVQIGIARRIWDDAQLADALITRAAVRERMGARDTAAIDLAEAGNAAGRLKDASYRAHLHAGQLRVQAMLTSSPADAAALLGECIAHVSRRGDAMALPALYLQRARALRQNGNVTAAEADLQRGIAELELHRESLTPGEARWGAFHAAEELFDEAIDLAIEQRDAGAAFATAERARARALLDSYGRSPALDLDALPHDTVVVEYAALPSRLVIFTAAHDGVRAATAGVTPAQLAHEVGRLTTALKDGDASAIRRAAVAMHRRLIEPVASRLRRASTVVFVPDDATAAVPFSALADTEGFLLERYVVIVAPSAAVYAAIADRRKKDLPKTALIVASSGTETSPLAAVRQEAQHVARLYRNPVELQDGEASFDNLLRYAPTADVIHFAGHGVGDDSGLEPASLLLTDGRRPRRVGAGAIARLRLNRAPVVVLAGCDTARGERRAAEGVVSIAHAFLAAGAPSVIATLWPIDDRDAAVFFPRLHARLAAGEPAAKALRAVQLQAIRHGDVPPSLWAALRTIGR